MDESKIFEIISDILFIDIHNISLDSHLINDLNVDSLGVIELVLAFESEINEDIPEIVIEQIKTVKDIVTYLKSR